MEEFPLTPGEILYEVVHHTSYRYGGEVTLSPQAIRVTPRHHRHSQALTVSPEANLRSAWDAHENPTRFYEKIGEVSGFEIRNRLRIVRSSRNPFDFLLEPRSATVPVSYDNREAAALTPYVEKHLSLPDEACALFPNETETIPFLVGLNQAIHRAFGYRSRDAPGILTPQELFSEREGTCRDFASLLQLLLKQKGYAARFASGYLLETGEMQGADAMHAWVEVFLPGAGWIGLDPTNGALCDDSFVPCAVGIHPDETAPVEGRYYADGQVPSEMEATLRIEKVRPGDIEANRTDDS